MKLKLTTLFIIICIQLNAQKTKSPISISGTVGVTYEGYGLTVHPQTPVFYTPRRPWNQVRFVFMPTIKFSKDFTLPININFAAFATNFAGPFAGIKNQNLGQYLTNPMNNFGLNPKYKWAELQLGTQYLNYSELSTGDIGVFGIGFDLKPKNYLLKLFMGNSQQGINFAAAPLPGTPGAYKQNNWMAQIGKEKEGKYKVAFNFAKAKDVSSSINPTPLVAYTPQENFVISFLTNLNFNKGYYLETEGAQSIFTLDNTNSTLPPPTGVKSFEPFIKANVTSNRDYAATVAFGKKSTNFDIGLKGKYLGAGFKTLGYPFQQNDKMDATINTRFNAWKDSNGTYKMNVVASVGNRVNNVSNTTTRANQFIGMLNWFTQFNDHFSLNISYNNFGFNTPGLSTTLQPSIRNVSNDIGINPTYTWSNTKMSHLLSFSYTYSKYKETVSTPVSVTTNYTTHTALLSYVPTYFNRKITPDFSMMYFSKQINPGFTMSIATISAGLGLPINKIKLHGQLQYTLGKTASFTNNNNLIASMNVDYAITKKLNWSTYLTTNYFKYGNELGVPMLVGANYLESTCRTGLLYRWK